MSFLITTFINFLILFFIVRCPPVRRSYPRFAESRYMGQWADPGAQLKMPRTSRNQ